MEYTEETISFTINGEERKALVRTPERLFRFPAFMMNFGLDRQATLDGECGIVSDMFLAAGHRVAALDLPNHGDRVDSYGNGLEGQAAAIKAGVDIFKDMRETATAFIDLMIERGLATENAIVIDGTSRGALMALHVYAFDNRVLALSIHAPVTYSPKLIEFSSLADNPIIQRSNAEALIPLLADKPLFIAIGSSDERIGAECCFDFFAKLRAMCTINQPVLFTGPGATHDISPGSFVRETGYFAAAGFLLQHCAEQLKMRNNEQLANTVECSVGAPYADKKPLKS